MGKQRQTSSFKGTIATPYVRHLPTYQFKNLVENLIEELPYALAAQAVPETTAEPKCRSGRIPAPVTRFELSFAGKKYAETTATTINQSKIHPDTRAT